VAAASTLYEFKIATKPGREAILEINSRPLFHDGVRVGFQAIARDVTGRVHVEDERRQSQRMESIGRLAGGIAHDFNNMLTVIQGHANLQLSSPGLDEGVAESAEEIQKAAERAANLTRQLLAFSRKQVIQLRDLDLNEVVGDMAKMLRRIVGEDIAIDFKRSPFLPRVRADQGMVEQVILNLVVNARDAMPKGGLLTIQTETVDAAPEAAPEKTAPAVRLSVTDTGCGIPHELLPHIFEPFFTTKEVGKGTGLGLATVYGIVQQHHGWIRASSVVNEGTTFSIYLPDITVPQNPASPEPRSSPAPRGSETILVVEDEAPLRGLMRRVLEQKGYTVLEAGHAVEAMEVWRRVRGRVDLVITDLVMPEGINGLELSIRLRMENPSLKVIYSTGYSKEVAGHDLPLEDGMHFLQKPYTPQTLARAARDCLDNAAPV
jgi:signal transduction histidine kinase/CheY-like chemotaxis protein